MQSTANHEAKLRAATAAFAAGDAAGAAQLASEVLDRLPHDFRARALRVNARLGLERWRDAAADLDLLLAAQPQNAQFQRLLGLCWLRIGNAHKAANEATAAAEAYRRSIAAAPDSQDARHNLGALLLAHDRAGDALPLLRIVAAAEPGNGLAALDLARAQLATGDRAGAIDGATALAERCADIDIGEASCALLLDAGATEPAARASARIAASAPERWQWVLAQTRRLRENAAPQASDKVLAALSHQRIEPAARLCLDLHRALGLPSVYADTADIDRCRARFADGLDRLIAEYPPRRIAELAPAPDLLKWDNFLLAYQGRNDRDLQRRFGAWYGTALQSALPVRAPAKPRALSRPRIAMISGRWHRCTVGVYFAAWVDALAGHGWEVILVHAGPYRDDWTERLARAAHGELTLTGPLHESATRVRDLDADIALYPELGMDSTVLALAALRLAPLQVCAWGHPSTTGLPAIDAFVSCAGMEPADAAEHYSERLLLLPGLGTRYPAPDVPAAAARADLGLPAGRTLYLVPQSAFKLHPDNDAVLARIVQDDGDALLVLFADRAPGAALRLRERLVVRLGAVAARPERHVVMLEQRPRADYLRVNLACDVMVDTLHWSGGNTTLDALHCGLPVVTHPGALMRGRQSAAMLRALGLDELVAESPEALADRAIALARDRERRARTSAALRAALPTLTNDAAPLLRLHEMLRQLLAEAGSR